ncbi:hypothetical protein INT45_006622 [Circinella minor]|uniref:GST C-terminal domain-containing protein n=1 Tax=Circinella minor TaxID=1195481 RepID=A0A8H7SB37_9FUNG|nr:hypothetical protein INT45_006622 [Circinella minor]
MAYRGGACSKSHSISIAFEEIGYYKDKFHYEYEVVDTIDIPSWYFQINPDGIVPTYRFNGYIIPDWRIILETAHEIAIDNTGFNQKIKLMPDGTPAKRAQVRFIIKYYTSNIYPAWINYLQNFNDEYRQKYITALESGYSRLNDLLIEQASSGPYFLGSKYTLADVVIAPIHARIELTNKAFVDGGLSIHAIKKSPRLRQFLKGITSRRSFKKTYEGDTVFVEDVKSRYGLQPTKAYIEWTKNNNFPSCATQ